MDHLFGTYVSAKEWPAGYGIEKPMPSSLGAQLLEPFMPMWAPVHRTQPANPGDHPHA